MNLNPLWINNNYGLVIIAIAIIAVAIAIDGWGMAKITAAYLKGIARNPGLEVKRVKKHLSKKEKQELQAMEDAKTDEQIQEELNSKGKIQEYEDSHPLKGGYITGIIVLGILAVAMIALEALLVMSVINA